MFLFDSGIPAYDPVLMNAVFSLSQTADVTVKQERLSPCPATQLPLQQPAAPASRLVAARRRRERTLFSEEALNLLHSVYDKERYPDIDLREELAQKTGVPEERILVSLFN